MRFIFIVFPIGFSLPNRLIMGIILAIVVVYLFLGNIRSTIITGIAIPNSLLGAFLLMYLMGLLDKKHRFET